MSDSWRLSFACTKADAERVADAEIDGVVLVATEEDEASGRWRIDVHAGHEPDAALRAEIAALAPGAVLPAAEPVAQQDWVTLSQAGLRPVRAGRFVVHTPAHPTAAPPGGRAFVIDAGQAFGTGHHETTAGCLELLDRWGNARFARVIDIGTGTGLLAFAARHLWPDAAVTATDIDPVSIAVTRENMAANAVDRVTLAVADGTDGPAIAAGAPYDLVIANILGQPLIALVGDVAAITAPDARLVLAGLLTTQAEAVAAAYAAHGFAVGDRLERGDWTILGLRRG